MQQSIIEDPVAGKQKVSALRSSKNNSVPVRELEIELGIWLSSIESFVGTNAHPFADKMNLRGHDWTGDVGLTSAGLVAASDILARLTSNILHGGQPGTLAIDELDSLTEITGDALVVSESLLRAKPLSFSEWRSWSRVIAERINTLSAFERSVRIATDAGDESIPVRLNELIKRDALPFGDRFDLSVIVPRFSRILRWLEVIERMLDADQPLKPALLIFARVYEDTIDLVGHINRRLQRSSDEDAELFRALDSASYIASIELRKVFDQELAGLVAVRSAITVYARTETAFASLRDNIQQILAGIARLIDPAIEPSDIFPIIGTKLEASLKLRAALASMTRMVRAAEQDTGSNDLTDEKLKAFLEGPVQYLFYKDRESVERFIEEILRTGDRKDLVPILHRFGAYLETLFGHVSNRTVLRDHPFEG